MKPYLVAMVLLLFNACQPGEEVIEADSSQLAGSWRLVEPSANGVTLRLTQQMPPYTVFTAVQTFLVNGESTVNSYSTQFSIPHPSSSSVTVAPIGSTKKAGPPEAMQFEQTYFTSLRTVVRYELTNQNRLRLYHGKDLPLNVLVYERIK